MLHCIARWILMLAPPLLAVLAPDAYASTGLADPRPAAVKQLGYDPEAGPVSECTRHITAARLLVAGLPVKRPKKDIAGMYLGLAGLLGAARAACSGSQMPPALPVLRDPSVWDAPSCAAAKSGVETAIKTYLEPSGAIAHFDLRIGFAKGVQEALRPIIVACSETPAWAHLNLTRARLRAYEEPRINRACSLWSDASYKELIRAKDVAKTHGRAAGQAHFQSKAMLALAGAKSQCRDDFFFRNTLSQFDLIKALIEVMPEKP